VFWIECKYCREAISGRVFWSNTQQLKHYREFQILVQPQTVYVVIGLGGWAKVPERIFCLPLCEVGYTGLYLSTLQRFDHRCGSPFKYAGGRLH
jgi:hypothetical protein